MATCEKQVMEEEEAEEADEGCVATSCVLRHRQATPNTLLGRSISCTVTQP